MIISENSFQFLIKLAAVTAAAAVLAIIATMIALILRDGNTPLVTALDNDLVQIIQYGVAAFVALLAGHGLTHIVSAVVSRPVSIPPPTEGKKTS